MDEEKDVLLEFCTTWCSGCNQARPVYEELALLYTSDKSLKKQVTLTRMNAEENDFPDRDVRGFPWLKLYPAHSKDAPLLYYSRWEIQDIAEFIRDHGTNKAMPKIPLGNAAVVEGL